MELKSNYRIGAANLGALYSEYRDYSRAVEFLEAGYKVLKPDLRSGSVAAVEVANNYAVALSGAGEFKKAASIYEEILDKNARNVTVLMNYAILLVEKLKDFKDAQKVLSRVKFVSEDAQTNRKVEELENRIRELEKEK